MTAARILRTAAYTAGAIAALTVVGFIEGLRRYDCCPHLEGYELYVPDMIGALS